MRIFGRPTSRPDGELRYGVRTREGRVVEFVVHSFRWVDGAWRLVAQFEHDPVMEQGHDVRTEGVHMDAFNPAGKKYTEAETNPGPLEPEFESEPAIDQSTENDERSIESDLPRDALSTHAPSTQRSIVAPDACRT